MTSEARNLPLGLILITLGLVDVAWLDLDLIPTALAQREAPMLVELSPPSAPPPQSAPITASPRPTPTSTAGNASITAGSPSTELQPPQAPPLSSETKPALADVGPSKSAAETTDEDVGHTHPIAPVMFSRTGSAKLDRHARAHLRRVAELMQTQPGFDAVLRGHTDRRGSPADNLQLAGARAESVRDFLVARGVDPHRIITRSVGASDPVDHGDTAHALAQNRRVDISLENR